MSESRKRKRETSDDSSTEKKRKIEVTPTPRVIRTKESEFERNYLGSAEEKYRKTLLSTRQQVGDLLQQDKLETKEILSGIHAWKKALDEVDINDTSYSNHVFQDWLQLASQGDNSEKSILFLLDQVDDIVDETFWNEERIEDLISLAVTQASPDILGSIYDLGKTASEGWEGLQDEEYDEAFFNWLKASIEFERTRDSTPKKEKIWEQMLKTNFSISEED